MHGEQRRRAATRAGRRKTRREISTLKEELKGIIQDVRDGNLDRNDAAVMIQAYRALKDFIELERKREETDEVVARIEELKRVYGLAK